MKRAILLGLVAVFGLGVVGCKEVSVIVTNNSEKVISAKVEGPRDLNLQPAMINPGTSYTFPFQVPDEDFSKKYTLTAANQAVDFTVNKNTPPNIMFNVTDSAVEGPEFKIQD